MASLQQAYDSSQISSLLTKLSQQKVNPDISGKNKKSANDFFSMLTAKTDNRDATPVSKNLSKENASLTFSKMKKIVPEQSNAKSTSERNYHADSKHKNSGSENNNHNANRYDAQKDSSANEIKKSAIDKNEKNKIDRADFVRAEEFSKRDLKTQSEKLEEAQKDNKKIVEQIDPTVLQTILPGVSSEQLVALLGLADQAETDKNSATPIDGEALLKQASEQGIISDKENSEQAQKGTDLFLQAMKKSEEEGKPLSAEDLTLKLAEEKKLELPPEISADSLASAKEKAAEKAPENFAAEAAITLDKKFAAQIKKQDADQNDHAKKTEISEHEETKSVREALTENPVNALQSLEKNTESNAQKSTNLFQAIANDSAKNTNDSDTKIDLNSDENLSATSLKNSEGRALEWTKISLDKPTETLSQQRQEAVLAQVKMGIENAQKKGERFISIELSPRDLGTIDIQMRVSKEGRTTVQIAADRAETLSMLQRESGTLKAMLQETLKTDTSMLNFTFHQSDGQSGHQAFDQAMQRQNSPWQTPQQKALTAELSESQQWRILSADSGRLDLRV